MIVTNGKLEHINLKAALKYTLIANGEEEYDITSIPGRKGTRSVINLQALFSVSYDAAGNPWEHVETYQDLTLPNLTTIGQQLGTNFFGGWKIIPTGEQTPVPEKPAHDATGPEYEAYTRAMQRVSPLFRVEAYIRGSAFRLPGVPEDEKLAAAYVKENKLEDDLVFYEPVALPYLSNLFNTIRWNPWAEGGSEQLIAEVSGVNPDLFDTKKNPAAAGLTKNVKSFFPNEAPKKRQTSSQKRQMRRMK